MSEKKSSDIFFTRHSKAAYKTYDAIVRSDNPEQPVDVERQVHPDLTPDGVKLATEKAGELLGGFDPQRDELFFVSSNEARALETAALYRDVAKEKGFTIIRPKNVHGALVNKIGGGDIRPIESLSLKNRNTLLSTVFNPIRDVDPVNWEKVDPQVKRGFEMARAIIAADDKGSWGANFFAHSAEIEKIFPELKSAEKVFASQFQNLLRLVKFADKKLTEHPGEKNIKVLAFGHENYVGYMLDRYFQEHSIQNCETLAISVDDGDVVVQKGQRKAIIKDIK